MNSPARHNTEYLFDNADERLGKAFETCLRASYAQRLRSTGDSGSPLCRKGPEQRQKRHWKTTGYHLGHTASQQRRYARRELCAMEECRGVGRLVELGKTNYFKEMGKFAKPDAHLYEGCYVLDKTSQSP